MMFAIREARPEDLNRLQHSDLKCFDYSWDAEEWKFAIENYSVKLATYYGTPVGFSVMAIVTEPKRIGHLFKLGVIPTFRRRKLGRQLIAGAMGFTQFAGLNEIEAIIPEMLCRPGEPQDILGFLAKVGFRATGVVPNYIKNMGVIEDGYQFNLRF